MINLDLFFIMAFRVNREYEDFGHRAGPSSGRKTHEEHMERTFVRFSSAMRHHSFRLACGHGSRTAFRCDAFAERVDWHSARLSHPVVQSTVESRFGNQLLWSTSAGLFSCQQANSCFLYLYEHAGVKKSMLDEGCKGFEKTTAFQIWHTDYCMFFSSHALDWYQRRQSLRRATVFHTNKKMSEEEGKRKTSFSLPKALCFFIDAKENNVHTGFFAVSLLRSSSVCAYITGRAWLWSVLLLKELLLFAQLPSRRGLTTVTVVDCALPCGLSEATTRLGTNEEVWGEFAGCERQKIIMMKKSLLGIHVFLSLKYYSPFRKRIQCTFSFVWNKNYAFSEKVFFVEAGFL